MRKGWLALTGGDDTQEKADADATADESNPVPAFERGRKLTPLRGERVEQKTRAPKRYSEASLVAKLESEGIGRPSTYAAVMDNIVGRSYVTVKSGYLAPTPSGELVVDTLSKRFGFMEVGFTRGVETQFDQIAKGGAAYKDVVARFHKQLEGELAALTGSSTPTHACQGCGKALRRIKSTTGHFWGCTGYPACNVSMPDADGKPGVRKEAVVAEAPCPACAKKLVHRLKTGRGGYDFWSCCGYRKGCKQTYPNVDGKPSIPTSSPTSSTSSTSPNGGARPASHA